MPAPDVDVPLDLLVKVLTYVPLSRRPDLVYFLLCASQFVPQRAAQKPYLT